LEVMGELEAFWSGVCTVIARMSLLSILGSTNGVGWFITMGVDMVSGKSLK
jgi:hypothetical protein